MAAVAEDCIASGTISVVVPNLEAFTDAEGKPKQITSTIENIGGLEWQMKIRRLLNPNRLHLLICCNEHVNDRLWLCKVRYTAEAWAEGVEDKPFYSFSNANGHFYGFNSFYWGLTVGKITNILEKKAVELKLKLNVVTVQESFPPLDTALVVNMGEGHSETLFVNKYAMASLSNYFRNLFFEDWCDKRERGGNHFELHEPADFRILVFKPMIYASMTMGALMYESNFLNYHLAYEIIKLAVKFDFPMMLDSCEKFLISKKKNSAQKLELLELADQYGLLIRLKVQCLNEISVLDYTEDLGKSAEIHSRLSKATREQLQEKLGGKAKELRESAEELEADIEDKSKRDLINRSKKLTKTLLR